MKKLLITIFTITGFFFPVFSHYQWITVDNYNPVAGNELNISINAGHNFPDSGFLLKRALIFSTELISKKKKNGFKIEKSGKTWTCKITNLKGNPNIVEFSLKKRTASVPFFRGRALIDCKGTDRNKIVYSTGVGLEIVPDKLFDKKQSDNLRIRILLDGKPVKSRLVVIPEGRKPIYLNPGSDNTMELKLKYKGLYLFNTYYKTKGASLIIRIDK